MYCLARSTSAGWRSRRTSRPYSGFPISAPKATAIGNPIIPVPGIPTPIAFLRTLELRITSICLGFRPSVSVACATQSDTATGSVQPIAGIISRCISCLIFFLSCGFNMKICGSMILSIRQSYIKIDRKPVERRNNEKQTYR